MVRTATPTLTLTLTLLLLPGCSAEELRLSVALPALTSGACDLSQIQARLDFPDLGSSCALTRSGDAYVGSCEVEAQTSPTRVRLEYLADALVLARADRKVTLAADLSITFSPGDLTYDDDDGDGIKNIDEHCLGSDPRQKDAPAFTGVISESGSIGKPNKTFVIGERVIVQGSNLPAVEHVTATMGPLLGKAASERVTVTPRGVTTKGIELQVPPGLDTTKDVELQIDALGLTWKTSLEVVRVWAAGARGVPQLSLYNHGGYTKYPNSNPPAVALKGGCANSCRPRLWDLTRDGRLLVAQFTYPLKSGDVMVVEVPTRTQWSTSLTLDPDGSVQLAAKDRYLALLDPTAGKLALRTFDADKRTIGAAPAHELAIKNAVAMIGSDASDDRLYVVTDGVAGAAVLQVQVTSEGKLSSSYTNPPKLPGCPALGCGLVTMHEVDDGRVVVARRALDRVELVDLKARSVKTATIDAPSWVDVAPRSKDRVVVAHVDAVTLRAGLCTLDIASFGSASPTCVSALTKGTPITVTIVPEQTHALMTLGGVYPNVDLFNLETRKFEAAKLVLLEILPHNIAVQP